MPPKPVPPAAAGLVVLALVLAAAPGCQIRKRSRPEQPQVTDLVTDTARRDVTAVAARLGDPDPNERVRVVRALSRIGGDRAAQFAATMLGDPDPAVRSHAAFAVGATGSDKAPELLRAGLPRDRGRWTLDLLGPAALGLGYCHAPAAEALLAQMGATPARPVQVPEALFNHYRWRDGDRPTKLPDDALLAYEKHPDPRGRAGIGWLGRVLRTPDLLEPLARLTHDDDPRVRRAAAMGLGNGTGDAARPAEDAERIAWRLSLMTTDPDPNVVVAACRALSSYPGAGSAQSLVVALGHEDFNVRTAAAAALGRRKDAEGAKPLAKLILNDSSTGARVEAARALTAIDPERAMTVVDDLLASHWEYVRAAGVEVLAEAGGDDGLRRVLALMESDPHVRVRHTALGALEGKEGPEVAAAVKRGLADPDPVVVAVACDVAVKNGLEDLHPEILAVPERFSGTFNADAREGVVSALGELGRPADSDFVRRFLDDPDVAVRWAARSALAKLAKASDPPDPRAEDGRDSWTQVPRAMRTALASLSPETMLVIETSVGTIWVELETEAAPLHCARVVSLAERGFYDGLNFHRVVPDFVIQGGCPRGDGSGTGGMSLPLEPTDLPFDRGVLGMPRSMHPDSGGCQLFICHSRAPHLDLNYTAFGRVVGGMRAADRVDVDTVIHEVSVEGTR